MQLMTSENRELRDIQVRTFEPKLRARGTTDLTSLPTVMLAMTFFTASRFSPFLAEFSACFSSNSSPATDKLQRGAVNSVSMYVRE